MQTTRAITRGCAKATHAVWRAGRAASSRGLEELRNSAAVRPLMVIETLLQFQARCALLRQPPAVIGEWLCKRLPRLGPVYVKVGQFISSRADIFGKELAVELAGLRDRVQPMDEADSDGMIQALLERTRACQDPIVRVERSPLASASIGQVHVGYTASRKRVAVKLKRPCIDKQIAAEISFILGVSSLIEAVASLASIASAPEKRQQLRTYGKQRSMLHDLQASLLEEADFAKEARNISEYAECIGRSSSGAADGGGGAPAGLPVLVPGVYSSAAGYSCSDMLVMHFLEGQDVAAYCRSLSTPDERTKFSGQLMYTFIEHAGLQGVIHGDPHVGNMCVQASPSGPRLVLYDFGNIVRLSTHERMLIKELIYTLLSGNADEVLATLRELDDVRILDEGAVRDHIRVYLQYIQTLDVGIFTRNAAVFHGTEAREMPIELGGKMYHLLKVFGTLEGVCKAIDPQFSYFSLIDKYVMTILTDEGFLMYKASKDMERLVRMFGL